MKDDDQEVREFLLRWLMEFGANPPTDTQEAASAWYMSRHTPTASREPYRQYFTALSAPRCVNQKGLDFIKGESL